MLDQDRNNILLKIDYDGLIRGMEFELDYNSDILGVEPPNAINHTDNLITSSNLMNNGKLKVVVADLGGGAIEHTDQSYLLIPINFNGTEYDIGSVAIESIKLVGFDGTLIDYISRSSNLDIKPVPSIFALHQNYPNPFNPITEIKFDISEAGLISLTVYNINGQKVKTLKNKKMQPGYYTIQWDGRNDVGKAVSTGTYFYSLRTTQYNHTKKMILLK